MVIEKTGGPVDYKEIPGRPLVLYFDCMAADPRLQSQSPGRMKSSSTSSTPASATLIFMPSTVTGLSLQSFPWSVVTKALVSL